MGQLIAFEGLDYSGKETQSRLLVDWIRSKGFDAVRMEFPVYDTPIGEEIRAYLYKQRDYTPREFQLLLEMNRYEQQTVIVRLMQEYDFVVLDRYHLSGLAYGAADGIDSELWERLQHNLIKPRLGIFIDITPEISMKRRIPGKNPDRYENDLEFLRKVYSYYPYFALQYGYRFVDGELSIEEVHKQVVNEVQYFFPQFWK